MLGHRLRIAREKAGYSQRELARILNIGDQQIWRYEKEETKPSSDVVASLANILGVSADYLLGITDDDSVKVKMSPKTRRIVSALERGDKLEAIRLISVDD